GRWWSGTWRQDLSSRSPTPFMSFSPRSVRGTTVRATATDRGRAMDMSCPKARVVSPAGFEPAIPALKGRCPWPLDDGDDRDGPGEPCRIRTCDPLLKRQLLYRLS